MNVHVPDEAPRATIIFRDVEAAIIDQMNGCADAVHRWSGCLAQRHRI